VSSFALVALLASSDAGTVLLLHPPGEASLPLSIFTVMANAPEAVVASLCLVHLLATVAVLVGVVALGALRPS
jgi:ABC-type Fe3+ transport system permease subunit